MGFNRIGAHVRPGEVLPRPVWPPQQPHLNIHQAPAENRIGGKLKGLVNALREWAPSIPGDFRQATEPMTATPVPMPPLSLRRYVGSTGYDPAITEHLQVLEKYIASNHLNRYEEFQNSHYQIGRGSSKDVYDLGNSHVMLVKERSGAKVANELMNLNLLRAAGFPVVKTVEAGTIRSRYASGNGAVSSSQAIIQRKLGGFYTFERVNREMHQAFLSSPGINKNTLASLRHIRHLCREQGISIHDLQGAIDPRTGVFHIADPTTLSKSSEDDFMKRTRDKNLDNLIRAVAAKLGRLS
jgi:hypothetical protein